MKRLYEYVDPMIGTVGDEQAESMHGGGKTHPGAVMPGGMVQFSPDTVTGGDNGTGYNYCQNTIEGFSINHMSGIGWYGDLGNLQMMPTVGETELRSGSNSEIQFLKGTIGWRSEFSHERESARAGYYSVFLERYGIFAETTASMHCGFLRAAYPVTDDARLIINLSRRIAGHADHEEVNVISPTRIEGMIKCTPSGGGFGRGAGKIGYDLYFVTEFSSPAVDIRFFENEEYVKCNSEHFSGSDVGVMVHFGSPNEPICVKTAISYVDLDGARNNFLLEAADTDFDSAVDLAANAWDNALSVIKADGSDETDMTLFYTCLYHSLLDPRTAVDADKRFVLNGHVTSAEYTQRTMFSGWDVYRSEFPLLTLIAPKIVSDEANSLSAIAQSKNSSFPRWELMGIDSGCMLGDPGLIVIADAAVKNIGGFELEKAYELALTSCLAKKEYNGKKFTSLHPSCEAYQKHAFVPNSLSGTLEFLLADYAMSRFAGLLKKDSDAEYFKERTKHWKDNYDKASGFLLPRNEDGSFIKITDKYSTKGCTESNIFQQSWFVPYDVEGLGDTFGKERALEMLEELFEKADLTALWNENYNHSNEPCHNLTHYFSILGKPYRTQYWTRRVQKEAYRLGAFGFCGNEDVGQLSAWYVLSAVGLAQVCPADDKFYINTPLFKNITIKLDKDHHRCDISDILTISTDKDPLEYPYISSVLLNKTKISRPYLTWQELTDGGNIEFTLTKEPI